MREQTRLEWRVRGGWSVFVAAALLAATSCAANDETSDDWDHHEDVGAIAIAGAWNPPADVRDAGNNQYVAYDPPPAWDGGAHCSGTFLPGTRRLGDGLKARFSQISGYGGYDCRQNTANARETSVHGTGRAIDVFIPMSGGDADNTKGDEVANWLVTHAQELGVQFIIWDRATFNPNRSPGAKFAGYGGPVPHTDHLHVELTIAAANNPNGPAVVETGSPVSPPNAPSQCGLLAPGQGLTPGAQVSSCDGRFLLVMQGDGNLVLYKVGVRALWATGTNGRNGHTAVMQGDGNFVLYSAYGRPLWASNTNGANGARLALQDDGNLVIYTTDGRPVWHTDTWERR